jgi:hypothetical protein
MQLELPVPDASLSEAIREAYTSAPSDVVILHTLELRHPGFLDEQGAPTAIRVVRDRVDLFAHLESSAPLHPGEEVRFVAMAFDLNLPAVDSMPVPEVEITLDNVTREVMRHLDAAVQSQQMIEVTYRPYLSNDLSGPQMDPPLTLVLSFVEANPLRISARARMVDIGNKAFPGRTYTAKEFPGLTR